MSTGVSVRSGKAAQTGSLTCHLQQVLGLIEASALAAVKDLSDMICVDSPAPGWTQRPGLPAPHPTLWPRPGPSLTATLASGPRGRARVSAEEQGSERLALESWNSGP